MENFQQFQPKDSPSWLMLERHIDDLVKVNIVNIAAIVVSLSDFEQWIRCAGMVAALIYTITKIVQTVQEIILKRKGIRERK